MHATSSSQGSRAGSGPACPGARTWGAWGGATSPAWVWGWGRVSGGGAAARAPAPAGGRAARAAHVGLGGGHQRQQRGGDEEGAVHGARRGIPAGGRLGQMVMPYPLVKRGWPAPRQPPDPALHTSAGQATRACRSPLAVCPRGQTLSGWAQGLGAPAASLWRLVCARSCELAAISGRAAPTARCLVLPAPCAVHCWH